MANDMSFQCQSDDLEEILSQVSGKIEVSFPEIHTNSRHMAVLAKELKNFTNNSLCIVPFCTTVEAEALGGIIKLGNEKVGPRVESYVYQSVEQLSSAKGIDLGSNRINEVLKCVEELSNEGEVVSLNVEGPFTIISSLIDPMMFYRGIRKNRETIDSFLKVIEDSIVAYILEGIKRGSKIISYGDPAGAADIVGQRLYEEISGASSYRILKRLECELNGKAIVHLCGKTSVAFEKLGLCSVNKIEFGNELSYGEALCKIIDTRKDVSFIGHSCIKRTRLVMKKPVVWTVRLNGDAKSE